MKIIILLFVLSISLLLTTASKAQIILEHTLDSTGVPYFYYTDIGNNDFKYVFLNRALNSFSLFNMDMSPFLINISIPVTNDSISQGFGVIYITKTLFDCDSTNLEYVYENPYSVNSKFRVFRTDGTMLLEVDSANGPYYLGGGIYGGSNDFRPIANTSDGTKLFLQKYNNNGIPEILIYGLCGILPLHIYDFRDMKSYVQIFPNPVNQELNFEISLPNNHEEFQITIFDTNSKEQKKQCISLSQNKCVLDVRNYNSGTYFYSLSSKNKIYQSGKFMISK